MDINHGQYYLLLTRQLINGDPGNSAWRFLCHGAAPKDCGAPPRTCLWDSLEDPRTIFWQNNIRFCLEMTFPGNLSLPISVLGAFERRHTFYIE
jgi:hypothetical protein